MADHSFKGRDDYVKNTRLPTCHGTIRPGYVMEVFLEACLQGAKYQLDQVENAEATSIGYARECLRSTQLYIDMGLSITSLLSRDSAGGSYSQAEILFEIAELNDHLEELDELVDETEQALEEK